MSISRCVIQTIILHHLKCSNTQVYTRLNHVGVCLSYSGTLNLMDKVSKLHTAPLSQWIVDGAPFKFWGDNVDKRRGVRDVRSDHHGSLLHMYCILAGRSRIPANHFSHTGCVATLSSLPGETFLPTAADYHAVRENMVILVSRVITKYIGDLSR